MFCICVQIQSQNLSNNLDCTNHSRVLAFLFFLPAFCSGVMVCFGSCRTVYIVDLGDSNFFSIGFYFFFFCFSSPFAFCLSPFQSSSLESSVFRFEVDCAQMGHWVPICKILLMTSCLGLNYLDLWVGGHCLLLWGTLCIRSFLHINKGCYWGFIPIQRNQPGPGNK